MSDEKRFTQAELDRIVKERIARERRKLDRETEQIEADDIPYKREALDLLKTLELQKGGLSGEQIEKMKKFVDGEDEDTIKVQAGEIVHDFIESPKKAEQEKKSKWNPFG
jgi:hypothetical protein